MKTNKILFLSFILCLFSLIQAPTSIAHTASNSATVHYDLAFPGMLPDNSLYKIKVLRDKVMERMIANQGQKIDFYLLQADKGILASAMLVDKKKYDLARETALKAENNITLISFELKKSNKKLDSETLKKIKNASLKHQEVLRTLIGRVPTNEQKTFKDVLYFSETNLKSIEDWQNKKLKTNKNNSY